ncbi:hypothetical protein LFZ31_20810, partial [Salmonella enterica subsp. enterica serovar Newport str. S09097]
PLADVQPGMLLRLTTGDRVPVDGEITQGEAWLDEAMLTGEPIPQQKRRRRQRSCRHRRPGRQRPVPRQRGGQSYHAVTHYSHGTPGAEQ